MKPNATLEDYQNREKFLIKYIESQIQKLENQETSEHYKWISEADQGRRKAYKDILFKLVKDED